MKWVIKTTFILVILCLSNQVLAQSITTTRHNLSISGPGKVKANSESQICIFCHTPHSSNRMAPLWNRNSSGATYSLYTSSTFNAMPGQPNGSSVLCLSCHDGTIALGSVLNSSTPIAMANGVMTKGNLTTDLSNDHPISFVYKAALANADGQLKTPPLATVKLDEQSRLQCTSCHDPHKNVYTKFLLSSNENSALCMQCHDVKYWTTSSHSTSMNAWNGSGKNPWEHIENPYPTVARNACENCHDPHNANGKLRLLKYNQEENNCMDCHDGTVASATKNLAIQFAKPYKHNVAGYLGIHDPAEANPIAIKHVECVDCHNPHASTATTAVAPYINGSQIGVKGISQTGTAVNEATYAYEVCYKCHAGQNWSQPPSTPRVINQNNVRLEFATTNPSFHPVVGARNNPDVGNLMYPNTASTVMYCTACHASDGGGDVANGPHGSSYPQQLKLQNLTQDGGSTATGTTESAAAYALCYSCHNRTAIIASKQGTFPYHGLHVVTLRTPCNTCHDPHGISNTQGNASNNSNLINFRTGVVTASGGIIRFVDTGTKHGSCQLSCHGKDHSSIRY